MQSQDFDRMQNNAIEYAREMQRKANSYDRNASETWHKHEEKSNADSRTYAHSSFGGRSEIKNIFNSQSNSNTRSDNDISLILALILLLSNDGGDKMLILALLYIMT